MAQEADEGSVKRLRFESGPEATPSAVAAHLAESISHELGCDEVSVTIIHQGRSFRGAYPPRAHSAAQARRPSSRSQTARRASASEAGHCRSSSTTCSGRACRATSLLSLRSARCARVESSPSQRAQDSLASSSAFYPLVPPLATGGARRVLRSWGIASLFWFRSCSGEPTGELDSKLNGAG